MYRKSTNKKTTIIYSLFRSIVLDYDITINKLRENDRIFEGGSLGNFSLAGFEMILHRHVSHYIINYYLPSGLFVVVSWISFLVPAEIIPGIYHMGSFTNYVDKILAFFDHLPPLR